ncbi:hypothetical protein [Streptomyces ochraceiscleroticus]|uniref:hypothetical protein n=1 Tax=Streptomyces ochraceiscleroticus TaxID=47761 RepID=UPI0004C62881|nr:hypothetical protein [Streptomyces ochraceiscleroticus]
MLGKVSAHFGLGESAEDGRFIAQSLKRAEMLGKVSAHFGLGESAEDGRFIAQSTLADLADLITAVQASAR